MKKTIETENLRLIACNKEILLSAIEGNHQLKAFLQVDVPENWTEFGIEALRYSLDKLAMGENEYGWWTYFPIHKKDNKLIGSGGYKGQPNSEGIVELGYEIAAEYRNKGFATELTKALIANAFACKEVRSVMAHTLAENNASTKVLTKCGFIKIEEIDSPEEGLIWKWEVKRMDNGEFFL